MIFNGSLSYLIDDYIYTNSNCTLYSYIDRYMTLLEARPDQLKLRREYFKISERIGEKLVDRDCIIVFNIDIDLLFYKYNLHENMMSINNNLVDFCKKWDIIFNKHKQNKLLKVICPAQKRFLDRLFNPHTPIGFRFGEKKRDELPWEETI